jgi:hypothetical protein
VESLQLVGRGGIKNFTFQSTARIGLLKGTLNAIKGVWEGFYFAAYCKMGPEPKEGGEVKSYQSNLSWANKECNKGRGFGV